MNQRQLFRNAEQAFANGMVIPYIYNYGIKIQKSIILNGGGGGRVQIKTKGAVVNRTLTTNILYEA